MNANLIKKRRPPAIATVKPRGLNLYFPKLYYIIEYRKFCQRPNLMTIADKWQSMAKAISSVTRPSQIWRFGENFRKSWFQNWIVFLLSNIFASLVGKSKHVRQLRGWIYSTNFVPNKLLIRNTSFWQQETSEKPLINFQDESEFELY